jgi:hypothetical protein
MVWFWLGLAFYIGALWLVGHFLYRRARRNTGHAEVEHALRVSCPFPACHEAGCCLNWVSPCQTEVRPRQPEIKTGIPK